MSHTSHMLRGPVGTIETRPRSRPGRPAEALGSDPIRHSTWTELRGPVTIESWQAGPTSLKVIGGVLIIAGTAGLLCAQRPDICSSLGRGGQSAVQVGSTPLRDPAMAERVGRAVQAISTGSGQHASSVVYRNVGPGALPQQPLGYYQEWIVTTARSAERIVTGLGGEVYFSPDHYRSFVQIS